jgi:hypothetical protein
MKSKWEYSIEKDSDGKRWDVKMMEEMMGETNEGLYDKYRVIKTADLDQLAAMAELPELSAELKDMAVETVKWVENASISGMNGAEGSSFVFVLRPDHDYHARVALAAYAASVVAYNPQLADDLNQALDLMEVPSSMVPD